MKIVICDDDKFIRDIFKEIFEQEKIDYYAVQSGEEVLEVLNNDKAVSKIFLDYSLDKMNGIETAQKIKEIDKNVEIYLLSGWNQTKFSKDEMALFTKFLKKPFDLDEIVELF